VAGARGTAAQSIQYGMELEGVFVGGIASFAGGNATADVVVEQVGQDGVARKHLGAVKYEDIRTSCGTDMADSFFDWLQQAFSASASRKNGAIVTYDSNGNEVSRLSFFNGLISEIGFPALDASSKDDARLTIKISPEHTRDDTGNSKLASAFPNGKKKTWMVQNYRLTIDGVPYSRVNRVEAITVTRTEATGGVGALSDDPKTPTYVVVPDLTVRLADNGADTGLTALRNWFNSFVIAGINGQEQEKTGTLEYLSSDLKTALFTLDLRQLGVYCLSLLNDSGETIRQIQARMYCEQIEFSYTSNAAAATNSQPSGSSSDNQAALPTLTFVSPPALGNLAVAPANQGVGSSAPGQPLAVPTAAARAPRNLTPAQGPRNLPPVQEQTLVPSPQPRTSLVFRNLSQ
jgi:phage tail-like protein